MKDRDPNYLAFVENEFRQELDVLTEKLVRCARAAQCLVLGLSDADSFVAGPTVHVFRDDLVSACAQYVKLSMERAAKRWAKEA